VCVCVCVCMVFDNSEIHHVPTGASDTSVSDTTNRVAVGTFPWAGTLPSPSKRGRKGSFLYPAFEKRRCEL